MQKHSYFCASSELVKVMGKTWKRRKQRSCEELIAKIHILSFASFKAIPFDLLYFLSPNTNFHCNSFILCLEIMILFGNLELTQI